MSLLEQNNTRKEWEFLVPEFESSNDKEYKMEAIRNSAVYAKEANGHLLGLYYLVIWKGYPEEENTSEPSSAVMHLRKVVSTFYKDYPEKLTAISAPLDSALPIAKPTIQLPVKWKRGQLTRRAKKHAKWGDKEEAIKKRQQRRGNKEEATRKRWQGGIRVSGVLEPEAGRRPEICLPGARSVGEFAVAV